MTYHNGQPLDDGTEPYPDEVEDRYDEGPDDEDDWCECCHNTGELDCLCGGDLCVCRNGGSIPCPRCSH